MNAAKLICLAAIAAAIPTGYAARAQEGSEEKATGIINDWATGVAKAYESEKGQGRENKMRTLTTELNRRLGSVVCDYDSYLDRNAKSLDPDDVAKKLQKTIEEKKLPIKLNYKPDCKGGFLNGEIKDIRFTIGDEDRKSAGASLQINNLIAAWGIAVQKAAQDAVKNKAPEAKLKTTVEGISKRIEQQIGILRCRKSDTFDFAGAISEQTAKYKLPVIAEGSGGCGNPRDPDLWWAYLRVISVKVAVDNRPDGKDADASAKQTKSDAHPAVPNSANANSKDAKAKDAKAKDVKAKDAKAKDAKAKDSKSANTKSGSTSGAKKDDKTKKASR